MILRATFPQVYELEHPHKGRYYLVSARSTKWGLNERKTFQQKELAIKHAKDIEAQIIRFGKSSRDSSRLDPQASAGPRSAPD